MPETPPFITRALKKVDCQEKWKPWITICAIITVVLLLVIITNIVYKMHSPPVINRIRILAVADVTMADHHKHDLEQYISRIFNIADLAFGDKSLGQEGKVQLELVYSFSLDLNSTRKMKDGAKIYTLRKMENSEANSTLDSNPPKYHLTPALDPDVLLSNFCAWQQKFREQTHMEFHAAIFFTRKNLYRRTNPNSNSTIRSTNSSGNESNNPERNPSTFLTKQILGMSHVGAICNQSCAVVQDTGIDTPGTLAHELGHLLFLMDDNSKQCDLMIDQGFIDRKSINETDFIMQDRRIVPTRDSWIKWSPCSKIFMEAFISDYRTACIRTPSPVKIQPTSNSGVIKHNAADHEHEDADPQIQCQRWLQNSRSSTNKTLFKLSPCPGPLNCNQLSCLQGEKDGCITSMNRRWLDKTPCGKSSWCINGVCVEKTNIAES